MQDREGWTPLDYIEQYIDKALTKMIPDCSNATSLARSGNPLNTSTDEIDHFFRCLYFDVLRTISYNQDGLVQILEIPCHH